MVGGRWWAVGGRAQRTTRRPRRELSTLGKGSRTWTRPEVQAVVVMVMVMMVVVVVMLVMVVVVFVLALMVALALVL